MMGPWRGSHKLEHDQLGIPEAHAVVQAYPATPQVYCSPIAGDPDNAEQQSISEMSHIATGFLLPKAGVLEEIHMICQGNTGSGAPRAVRWTVHSIVGYSASPTGLRTGPAALATGVTSVADNVAGDVTVVGGLGLLVPAQFLVFLKAAYTAVPTERICVQAMRSGGPIPGVVGYVASGPKLVSAPTYQGALDLSNPPGAQPANTTVAVSMYKGLSVYIKWRAV